MPRTEPSYVASRAESLAVMHLTRRDDLQVSRQPADQGIDLLVTIRKNGKISGRLFGVRVKGMLSASGVRSGRVHVQHGDDWARTIPFPICLFAFTMPDDRGFYRWIKEPVLPSRGGAALRVSRDDALAELSDDSMDAIVEAVDEWYERSAARSAAVP